MALEDKDIFLAVCARYPDQSMEFVMEQYALARKKNREIEQDNLIKADAPAPASACTPVTPVAPAKKYTKRNLVIKPQEAITDEVIYCCLCGSPKKHLSSSHLATHGIGKEEYKTLCGYPPEVSLMAKNSLAKSRRIIQEAQKKRLNKKANPE